MRIKFGETITVLLLVGCVLLLMISLFGCVAAPSRPADQQKAAVLPEAGPVAVRCAGNKDNLIYEHITPFEVSVARQSNKKADEIKTELPNPGDLALGWGKTMTDIVGSPGFPELAKNAPEFAVGTAGIISALNGTWVGIIPSLVTIPVRSFQRIVEANCAMQRDIEKLDVMLVQMTTQSGNQVETERVYLPEHAKSVYIKSPSGFIVTSQSRTGAAKKEKAKQ